MVKTLDSFSEHFSFSLLLALRRQDISQTILRLRPGQRLLGAIVVSQQYLKRLTCTGKNIGAVTVLLIISARLTKFIYHGYAGIRRCRFD